ncbi:MAG: pilus assembly protein PilM [Planctomycetota bacterium]
MASAVYTGIDIGADAIKVLSLERKGAGFHVLGAGQARLPPDLPPEEEALPVLGAILARLVKSQRIPIGHRVVGLGGKGSLIRYLSMPVVPPWKLSMLISYEVEEHSGSASEVAYAYRILDLPEIEEGQFSVLLAQAQADTVDRYLGICRPALGRVHEVDLRSVALFNLYAASPLCNDGEVSLLVDIGAEETSLSLQKGTSLYFARSVSGGGARFTARLEQALGLSSAEAEEWKQSSRGIIPAGPEGEERMLEMDRRASEALRVEAGVLASAIQSSLVFSRNQLVHTHGPARAGSHPMENLFRPERILLTGGGARLGGLDAFLATRFGCPAELLPVGEVFARKSGSASVALEGPQAAHFACAAGLALARARPQGVGLNLITQAEKERRRFWDRTLYVALTGIVALITLVLSVVISYGSLAAEQRVDKRWKEAEKEANKVRARLDGIKKENFQLDRRVFAIEGRKIAGVDMLQCLDLLRQATDPKLFFFLSFETEGLLSNPDAAFGASQPSLTSRRMRDGTAVEPLPAPEGVAPASLPGTKGLRSVTIQGYCLAPDKGTAIQEVTHLADQLEKNSKGFFVRVEESFFTWLEDAAGLEKLASYFRDPSNPNQPKEPGQGAFFTLKCFIRDWR